MKRFMITLGGVLLLSFAVPVVAQASPQVSFTVSPAHVVVGEPVTVTDTTSNPDGYELAYEWAKTGFPNYDVRAGSPECLNAMCSQARWTYSSPGMYEITELVSWPGAPDGGISSYQRVTVVDPADAPAPIYLTTPTTVSLPTVLEAVSPKPHLQNERLDRGLVFGGCKSALSESAWGVCEPYLIGRTGPDASGLYHYRFRLVMANPGVVELTFSAWNAPGRFPFELIPEYADTQTFTLNVIGNAYQFGDVRSCRYPNLMESWMTEPLHNLFELDYYAAMNSRVTLGLEVRRGRRWVTVKHAVFSFWVKSPRGISSPWVIRSAWGANRQARFAQPPSADQVPDQTQAEGPEAWLPVEAAMPD